MKAVVFDMDGVLFDTEAVCLESWLRVAQNKNLPGMREVFPRCIGLNANDTETVMYDAYGKDFDYVQFRQEASIEFRKYIAENGLPQKPGAKELLEWLKTSGYRVGLASSTRKTSVLEHLREAGFESYFSVVISGDMVEHSKPQPDIYLMACEELGVEPAEAYAIEDSFNGIRSAHAAGMKPVMVPDMLAPDEEMRKKSHEIFDDLFGVLQYLQKA